MKSGARGGWDDSRSAARVKIHKVLVSQVWRLAVEYLPMWVYGVAGNKMNGIESNLSRKKRSSTIGAFILVVEDHEPTRLAVTRLLHRRHYKVVSAASCSQARSLIQKNDDFRLLISDVGLPDGSGYDLMAEFKQKFGANGIALTGLGREEDVERSRASGFSSHLTKPVRVEELEIALAATLQITTDKVFIKNGLPR